MTHDLSNSKTPADRLLCLSEVSVITTLSRATIYRLIQAVQFPPQRKIGNLSRWLWSDIAKWLDDLETLTQVSGSSQTPSALPLARSCGKSAE